MYKVLALLAVLPSTFAHFILNYPTALGVFKDEEEGTAPCGGYDINFSGNVTEVPVGGFAVALMSTHPQADWLYRITTSTEEPYNWTNILPVVSESGLGAFCLPDLTVPSSFVGQQAIIQVTQDAVDGELYQVRPCLHRAARGIMLRPCSVPLSNSSKEVPPPYPALAPTRLV